METPSMSQIAAALRTALFSAVGSASGVSIVPETSTFNPAADSIFVLQAFRPSSQEGVELSGRLGLAQRHGVFLATVSAPYGSSAKVQAAMGHAETIADAFRRKALDTAKGPVYCGEPSVVVVGKDPDERYSVSVSVPWTTWTGGVA